MPKPSFLHILDLLEASGADVLSTKLNDVFAFTAENAGVGILFENDRTLVGKDFKRILLLDIHRLTKFHGDNNPAKFVYLSNNTV